MNQSVLFIPSEQLIIFGTFFLCCLCVSILLGLWFVGETDAGLTPVLLAQYLERKSNKYAMRFQSQQNWILLRRKDFLCMVFLFLLFFFLLKKGKIHKWVRLYTWIVLLGSLKIWNCIFQWLFFTDRAEQSMSKTIRTPYLEILCSVAPIVQILTDMKSLLCTQSCQNLLGI